MIAVVVILILLSSYVVYAKMKEETKMSYFIAVGVVVLLVALSQLFASGGSA